LKSSRVTYNASFVIFYASFVIFYNATDSLASFENTSIYTTLKNALAYYNAGVVSCKFISRRIGSGLLLSPMYRLRQSSFHLFALMAIAK
jgi:hypothetical protein